MKKLLFDLRVKKISFVRSMIICTLFLIVGISAITLMASFADPNLSNSTASSITTDTVYVNDLAADYYYYKSLNYTNITSDSLPTKNVIYTDSNLVRVFASYSSTDYNYSSLVGHVSPATGETQTEYRYYKYYPKDSNGYITMELPDNLFTSRPYVAQNGDTPAKYYGFNGWVTDNANATVYLDKNTYTRYARVYVGSSNDLVISFKSSWFNANYRTGTSSEIANFDAYGMKRLPNKELKGNLYDHSEDRYYYLAGVHYYEQDHVNRNVYYSGYLYTGNGNNAGYEWRSETCTNRQGCTFLYESDRGYGVPGITLYGLTYNDRTRKYDRYNIAYDPANFDHVEYDVPVYTEQTLGTILDMPNNYNAVGMYYKTSSMPSGHEYEYYDASGVNCALGGSCNGAVYKLIHVTDPESMRLLVTEYTLPDTIEQNEVAGIMSHYTDYENYYYLVTRDMNILKVNNGEDLGNSYSSAKPYTLTGSAYGEAINNTLDTTSGVFSAGGDLVIENVKIGNGYSARVTENVYLDSNEYRVISANRHNLKIGRNANPATSGNFSFFGVTGTNSANTTFGKFKVIVESGVYDFLLSNGFTGSTDWWGNTTYTTYSNKMHGTFVYGSDYDRVSPPATGNLKLIITYCAYATNAGGLSADTSYNPSSTMIIKSGSYGKGAGGNSYDADYSHGLYVGSRGSNAGNDSSLREMIVEGGDINVINGGPLVNSSYYNKNVVALYMKGGKVRSIFGGAGRSETGGNRIVSVTGGEVTNNVFGGSNSYNGTGSDGYMNGDTLVYIGGNVVIGTANSVLWNDTGQNSPGVGDVFGAGNGRSGNNYANIGTVNNSHVIIDGGTINGSVYGGGNFGSVGLQINNAETTIDLLGGTIVDSVYGAGNNAGGGGNYGSVLSSTYYTGRTNFYSTGIPMSGYAPNGVYYNNVSCNESYPGATYSYYPQRRYNCEIATGIANPGDAYSSNTTYYTANGTSFSQVNNPSVTEDTVTPPLKITINLDGSSVEEAIYGGSNTSGTVKGETNVNLISNTSPAPNVYGGGKGESTYIRGNTNVTATPSSDTALNVNDVYGGSAFGHVNTNGAFETKVNINGGTIHQVYGGGEGDANTAPETAGDITVNINGGVITDVFGANNKNGVPSGSIEVHLVGGTITNNAYGGGNESAVDITTIYLEGSTVTNNVFGGSNASGDNNATIVHINSGSAANVFGGNNEGGTVDNTYVYYDGASVTTAVYGCGYGSGTSCDTTNVVVNGATGTAVYGGGYASDVDTSTNVMMVSGTIASLYGGCNQAGDVTESNVYLSGGTTTNVFGGNNEGGATTETHVNVGGGTNTNVYGGGNEVSTNKTNVDIYGGLTANVYGGGYSAGVGQSTNVNVKGGTVGELFGGSNSNGNVPVTNVNVAADGATEAYDPETTYTANNVSYTVEADGTVTYPTYTAETMRVNNVYGGNNAGGKSTTTNVTIDGGTTNNVYGGSKGTGALAGSTNVEITGGTTGNVYGGGDNAVVTNDTFVIINDGTVTNLFGGGNGSPATVQGSTYVIVNGGDAKNNVYGGGNNAVTQGNTTVSVVAGHVEGSLFGAGNNAPTGTENNNNSVSTVNILGGTIDSNVYGGANFSQVFGTTDVNIGDQTVSDERLENYTYEKEIYIGGTVFGGGEAKGEGEEYDWAYISVTQGLEIVIDGTDYDMTIAGSVFGSGNASSSAGVSNVIIKNFGTDDDVKTIKSIQRATNVMIINSSIQVLGEKDSTNKYNNDFTLNRIDNFYLLNNSSIYLKTGANVLKNFNSGYIDQNDEFQKETVVIDNDGDIKNPDGGEITSRNVNNRLFMSPNKNLNVLTEEELESRYAGNVNGMCFLGIYLENEGGTTTTMNTGIYNTDFDNGESVDSDTADLMKFSGTYVYGKHKDNHNITVDGFWSYYLNDDGDAVHINYVDVTPPGSNHYIWAIGVQLKTYEIELMASRYSTMGVKNLSLTGFENPNTQIEVQQFQYQNLAQGVTIVDKGDVKKVADSSAIANSKFGLEMGTTDTGWKSSELTRFFSASSSWSGSRNYETESTAVTPTLSFYLYNSKNIELPENEIKYGLGYASVIMTATVPDPDDPLSFILTNIEVKVFIFLQENAEDGYSSVISPGKKYSVFPYMAANISTNGSVSIYHNLFLDLTGVDKNGDPWSAEKLYPTGAYRAIVSDYVYPVGTTVTMIDLTNNQYYYYTVTNDNIAAKQTEKQQTGEVSYYLSDFIKMDSISPGNHYDDATSNDRYLNLDQQNAFEEFIFTVDFSNANVTENVTSRLYLELRDPNSNDAPIISPLPFQGDRMKFKTFTDSGTQLITTGELSSSTLYVGESVILDLDTEYRQADAGGDDGTIYDTTYDDYQLGTAITFYDSQGNKLDGSSLLGVVITVGNKNYYAQTDGTYRVNLAGKVANVNSAMIINTASSNITSGEYTMKIETFASYDGLYSGEIKNEPLYLTINILNNKYGLLVESDDVAITHDKNDATDANGDKTIDFLITTSSGQDNPNLRVRLERRKYAAAGDLDYEYESVDMTDFFVDNLTPAPVNNENKKLYYVTEDLPEEINFSLTLRDDQPLKTGTYRIVFGVYDGDNYIGSVYRYLIIREMK